MSGLALEHVREGDWDAVQRNFVAIIKALGLIAQVPVFFYPGDPNGNVDASPPALNLNLSGGASTTFWVKETGAATNTGWVGK